MEAMAKHNASWYPDSLTESPSNSKAASIRLLTILPGKFDDPIECVFKTGELSNSSYRALSYTWGTAQGLKSITLNGRSGFRVTQNAYSALRRIRSAPDDIDLWIDAVCINQANIEERNAQVAMMGRVFSEATKVLVYLGHCSAQSPEGPEPERCPLTTDDGVARDMAGTASWHHGEDLVEGPYRNKMQLWWLRSWTFQEAMLAKELEFLIGPHRVYTDYMSHMNPYVGIAPGLKETLQQIEDYKEGTFKFDLFRLLNLTDRRSASDERDKIFSLRALCESQSHAGALAVDYSKSLDEVGCEAVDAMVKDGYELRLLYENFGLRNNAKSGSWLPDIFTLEGSKIPALVSTSLEDWVQRDPPNVAEIVAARTSISNGALHTQGFALDSIAWCVRGPTHTEARSISLSDLSWHYQNPLTDPPTSNSFRTRRVLSSGIEEPEKGQRGTWLRTEVSKLGRHRSDIAIACGMMRGQQLTAWEWQMRTEFVERGWDAFADVIWPPKDDTLSDRPNIGFFVTEGGLVGFGEWFMQEGDKVAMLSAFPQPVILRPVDPQTSDAGYRVISEAWMQMLHVDNIDLKELYEKGQLSEEDFKLV